MEMVQELESWTHFGNFEQQHIKLDKLCLFIIYTRALYAHLTKHTHIKRPTPNTPLTKQKQKQEPNFKISIRTRTRTRKTNIIRNQNKNKNKFVKFSIITSTSHSLDTVKYSLFLFNLGVV